MTSQAYGQHDLNEITRLLSARRRRSIHCNLSVNTQYPILKNLHLLFYTDDSEVEQLATTYFYICIWGAPAMLGLYGLQAGYQECKTPFPVYIAITQNIVNIIASFVFVYLLDMKVAGVAIGTLTHNMQGSFHGHTIVSVITTAPCKRIEWHSYRSRQCTVSSK